MMDVIITPHARYRAVKRLMINRELADDWIRSSVKRAKYIADVVSEKGNPGKLYAHEKVTFVLSKDERAVLTLYQDCNPASAIRQKVGICDAKRTTQSRTKRTKVSTRS
ncbi:hypothetical protein P7H20_01425 [Paenibacillus larvae]|nr:hypothetical protein [Paenibacillus larvae]MDT2273822.1 hypothetical protein [Paenibacillus larvae]